MAGSNQRVTRFYRIHGLRVDSDLPITAADAAPGDKSELDLRIRARVESLPPHLPGGTVLAGDPNGRWYTVTSTPDGPVIHVPGLCRFDIDPSLKAAMCVIDPAADMAMAAILAGGNLIATILGLRGVGVLHASAVAFDGRAIAIAGASGMGKSTIAALLCEAGGLLVGDDVLRLTDPDLLCLPGSTQIRLRPQARALAGAFDAASTSPTPDDRIAVTPAAVSEPVALTAVLLPRPSRERQTVECIRLPGAQAATELLRCARIFGWRHRPALQAQFDLATRIAAVVPVFEAHIPWGPPFPPQIAAALREAAQ